MAVFELAGLANLQRLSLVRVQKLTDNAVFFLAEHATELERLHLSYCDRLSLFAVQHLLRKLAKLQHLTATGIPAFRRKGIKRFSDPPPSVSYIIDIDSRLVSLNMVVSQSYDSDQQAAFRVFSGANVPALHQFLDKEQLRRRESETKNLKFIPRADDKLDLY
jgi:F-box and leucine-rich repeat protein GRR1